MTDHTPKPGEMGGVRIVAGAGNGGFHVECSGQSVTWLPRSALHSLPPALSPEAQAVIEASNALYERWPGTVAINGQLTEEFRDWWAAMQRYRASVAPPPVVDPVERVLEAARVLLETQSDTGINVVVRRSDRDELSSALASLAAARAKGGAP